jgi:hypothetical protein
MIDITREALISAQTALYLIKSGAETWKHGWSGTIPVCNDALAVIKTELAAPAPEPVAYTVLPELLADVGMSVINAELPKGTKVYAVPPDTAALQARIAALEERIKDQVIVMRQVRDFIDYIAITNAAQRMLDVLDDTIKKEMP